MRLSFLDLTNERRNKFSKTLVVDRNICPTPYNFLRDRSFWVQDALGIYCDSGEIPLLNAHFERGTCVV